METAVAARKAGLDVILYLETITPNKAGDDRANILVDKILGAKIHYVSMADRTEGQADAFAMEEAKKEAAELAKTGHKAYIIPVGGATPIGSTGFALGFKELIDQLPDVAVDYIVQGSGTGGTAAGLIAGAKAFSKPNHPTQILSINVSPKPEEHYQKVVNIANDALGLLGLEQNVSLADTHFDQSYFGDGYEIPSESGSAAIQLLARTEGILTDPVYTGKAFAGLLDYVKTSKIKPGVVNTAIWRDVFHNIAPTTEDANGQSAADNLTKRGEIWFYVIQALRPVVRRSESGHHFVKNQQCTSVGRQLTKGVQEFLGSWDNAHVPCNRLHDDGSDFWTILFKHGLNTVHIVIWHGQGIVCEILWYTR